MRKRKHFLEGTKVGRLNVLEYGHRNKKGKVSYLCQCECGKFLIVSISEFIDGQKSCGCLWEEQRLENVGKRIRKYCQFFERDGYMVGISTNTFEEFYFDLEDFNQLKDHAWYVNKRGYVYAKIDSKAVPLHRLVLNTPKGMHTDHINHNKLDNRKKNLRACDSSHNQMNAVLRKDNMSGVKGVYFNTFNNKWAASISHNKKQKFLGYFINKEDAIKARLEAEDRLFKEFKYNEARTNIEE